MSNKTIVVASLYFIYYHISGLSTTNILRLTSGNTQPILSSKCYCDACGMRISPFWQLPIISYVICKGRCRGCNSKIPFFSLILEIIIFSGMSIISTFFQYSFTGVSFSFIFYELLRILTILFNGKRNLQFTKQYLIAVLSMLPFYCSALFVALLYKIV